MTLSKIDKNEVSKMTDNQAGESRESLQDKLNELQQLLENSNVTGKRMEFELRKRGYVIYHLKLDQAIDDVLTGRLLCEVLVPCETRVKEIARELTQKGYEGCDESEILVDIHQVQRVLNRAIAGEAIRYVNLRELPDFTAAVMESMFNIKTLTAVDVGGVKSPLHLVTKKCIKVKVKPELVKKLIECQFEIKWDTDKPNGEPEDFNYFAFCNEGVGSISSYKVRKAHVLVQLYRISRLLNPTSLVGVTRETLCPPVYVKTSDSGLLRWKIYNPSAPLNIGQLNDFDDHFSWMNEGIRGYIKNNAVERNSDCWEEDLTGKYTLYWAVVEETDMECNEVGRTQVYVGKTQCDILTRWIISGRSSHCAKMKNCLDKTFDMKTYSPPISDYILVDVRLLLTKLRNLKANRTVENCALFVMKIFDDEPYENAKKDYEENRSDGTKKSDYITQKKRIGEALKDEEKNHRNGIITWTGSGVVGWSPKKMQFGMNNK